MVLIFPQLFVCRHAAGNSMSYSNPIKYEFEFHAKVNTTEINLFDEGKMRSNAFDMLLSN